VECGNNGLLSTPLVLLLMLFGFGPPLELDEELVAFGFGPPLEDELLPESGIQIQLQPGGAGEGTGRRQPPLDELELELLELEDELEEELLDELGLEEEQFKGLLLPHAHSQ